MCLIVFAWKAHPAYSLVLAANRDEFFDRPSTPLDYWDDMPGVLGGRDLQKGGSWLAANVDGRWAAVTNFRDGRAASPSSLSRGQLVLNYVASGEQAEDYALNVMRPLTDYPGCNLLIGDADSLFFVSNRNQTHSRETAAAVAPGFHGLSNHLLDTPWPKVQRCKRTMQRLLDSDSSALGDRLFELLADRTPADDDELPSTGVPHEWERTLSAPFIVADGYGTRASTVVLMDHDGTVAVHERSFGAGGIEIARRVVTFKREQHSG